MRQHNPISTLLARGASLLVVAAILPLAASAQKRAIKHDPNGAAKHFKETRSWPNQTFDMNAYYGAMQQSRKMAPAFGVGVNGANVMAVGVPPPKTPTWSYIGPNNTPGEPFGGGPLPVSGRANAVAYDPNNPTVYYVASASGGVWRTADNGKTWTVLSLADQFGRTFSSVTVDPNNSNIVYAGSGDYENPGTYPGSFGFGVVKFVFSGGGNYTASVLPGSIAFGKHCIRKIVVDPTNSQHLMVAVGRDQDRFTIEYWATGVDFLPDPPFTPNANVPAPNGGIYDSVNGGTTFPKSFTGVSYFSNIAYAANPQGTPANQLVLYASADFGGVYKSVNNGGSWFFQFNLPEARWFKPSVPEILNRLASFDRPSYRVDVAPSLIDVNTCYVLVESTRSVYKTTDAGATWASISNSLPALTGPFDTWGQADYDFQITCSSATTYPQGSKGLGGVTTDCVYVGLYDVYQSFDGTDGWAAIGRVYTPNEIIHTDQHAMAVNPHNPNDMLIGNDGGVYHFIFSPPILDFKFFSLNAALGDMQLYFGSYGYTDATRAFVAAQDNSTPHGDGDLANWLNPGSADGTWTAINPLAPGVQYYTEQAYGGSGIPLFFTEDDWQLTEAFAPVPADVYVSFVPPLVMDPLNADILYAGEQYVYQGVHVAGTPIMPPNPPVIGTLTWTKGSTDLTDDDPTTVFFPGDYINAMAVSPFDNSWVYAGTLHGFLWYQGSNSDWARIDSHITDTTTTPVTRVKKLPNRPIGAIAASNTNPKRIYVGLQGDTTPSRLYISNNITVKDNLGNPNVTFTSISGNPGPGHLPDVPINAIVVLPHDDEKEMYVGTDLGVYRTVNGGTTWTNAGSALGLPTNILVTTLTFNASTGYLDATTYGRGAWSIYIGNNVPFKLYPTLQSYRGARSKLSTVVRFYHTGEPVLPSPAVPPLIGPVPTPTEQKTLKLDASGWLLPNTSVRGTFDIWFKVDGFLSKRLKNVGVGNTSPVSDLVFAGDVNPTVDLITGRPTIGDNVLNLLDLNAVALHFGQFWHGPEDVDGDGVVTIRDYNLIVANIIAGHVFGDP